MSGRPASRRSGRAHPASVNAVPRSGPDRHTAAVSAGTRVAGLVLALGYLLGLVGGPLVAVVGGLALVTYGRGVVLDRGAQALSATALAVMAGAVGVAGLRWGTLDLNEIRSVQAVLGPTLMVGPGPAAAAAGVAVVAAIVALAVWLAVLPARGARQWLWTGAEAVAPALAVVTAFWGAKVVASPDDAAAAIGGLAIWVGAVAAVLAIAAGAALLLRLRGSRFQVIVMSVVTVAVFAAAGTIGAS